MASLKPGNVRQTTCFFSIHQKCYIYIVKNFVTFYLSSSCSKSMPGILEKRSLQIEIWQHSHCYSRERVCQTLLTWITIKWDSCTRNIAIIHRTMICVGQMSNFEKQAKRNKARRKLQTHPASSRCRSCMTAWHCA